MLKDLSRILISQGELDARIADLAADISLDYKDKFPVFIGILKGSFIFLADLIRNISFNCLVDFMAVSSYGSDSSSSGAVSIKKDLDRDINNRHVILVEDILDTGLTLSFLINYLSTRLPASIRICTLLDKPSRRKIPIQAHYTGFEVPDEFLVGFGLDYDEKYRNFPFIGVLKPELYSHM